MTQKTRSLTTTIAQVGAIAFALTVLVYLVIQAQGNANPKPTDPGQAPAAAPLAKGENPKPDAPAKDAELKKLTFLYTSKSAVLPSNIMIGLNADETPAVKKSTNFLPSSKSFPLPADVIRSFKVLPATGKPGSNTKVFLPSSKVLAIPPELVTPKTRATKRVKN